LEKTLRRRSQKSLRQENVLTLIKKNEQPNTVGFPPGNHCPVTIEEATIN